MDIVVKGIIAGMEVENLVVGHASQGQIYEYSDFPIVEPLPLDYIGKACMLHVEKTGNFFIGHTSDLDASDHINDLCLVAAERSLGLVINPSDVRKGTIWLGLFSDEAWYRCMALGPSNDLGMVNVIFLDFGNQSEIELISGIRYISPSLMSFPPVLINCGWHELGAITEASFRKLKDLADESIEFFFNVCGHAPHAFGGTFGEERKHIIRLKTLDGMYIQPSNVDCTSPNCDDIASSNSSDKGQDEIDSPSTSGSDDTQVMVIHNETNSMTDDLMVVELDVESILIEPIFIEPVLVEPVSIEPDVYASVIAPEVIYHVPDLAIRNNEEEMVSVNKLEDESAKTNIFPVDVPESSNSPSTKDMIITTEIQIFNEDRSSPVVSSQLTTELPPVLMDAQVQTQLSTFWVNTNEVKIKMETDFQRYQLERMNLEISSLKDTVAICQREIDLLQRMIGTIYLSG